MIGNIIFIVVFAAYLIGVAVICTWLRGKVPPWAYSLGWAIWCTVWFFVDFFAYHNQVGMGLNALIGSYWWRDFWRKKPPFDRKKVAKLIGAKARALKEKLVAAMPKPSLVSKAEFAPVGA